MAELASRTGVPVRKLRYAFDHRVLPGATGASSGQGVPRTFTDFEGFGIALAASLLDSGLTRKLVAGVLTAVARALPNTREDPLLRAFQVQAGTLEIGDGRHLRLQVPKCRGIGPALDTGWRSLADGLPMRTEGAFVVRVTVELGAMAKAVSETRVSA
jgi:hypothetical protein